MLTFVFKEILDDSISGNKIHGGIISGLEGLELLDGATPKGRLSSTIENFLINRLILGDPSSATSPSSIFEIIGSMYASGAIQSGTSLIAPIGYLLDVQFFNFPGEGTVSLNAFFNRFKTIETLLSGISTAEAAQIANIGSSTFSAFQWALLAEIDQDLSSDGNVSFHRVTLTDYLRTPSVVFDADTTKSAGQWYQLPIGHVDPTNGILVTFNNGSTGTISNVYSRFSIINKTIILNIDFTITITSGSPSAVGLTFKGTYQKYAPRIDDAPISPSPAAYPYFGNSVFFTSSYVASLSHVIGSAGALTAYKTGSIVATGDRFSLSLSYEWNYS